MDLDMFLNRNRIKKENIFYEASSCFKENGKKIKWQIRALSGSEEEKIRETCIRQVQRRNGGYSEELDYSRYLGKLAAASTVYPDLYNFSFTYIKSIYLFNFFYIGNVLSGCQHFFQ
jgi:hypothetical protein